MSDKSYSPEQALKLLLKKVRTRSEYLAKQVETAIDAGKDVSEIETVQDRRKKDRIYRKTVSFTHEEALQVAMDVLQAHFLEQPLFVVSAASNFTKAGEGHPIERPYSQRIGVSRFNSSKEREAVEVKGVDEEKSMEIELQTETQIEKIGPETQIMKKPDPAKIEEMEQQLERLRMLVNFETES